MHSCVLRVHKCTYLTVISFLLDFVGEKELLLQRESISALHQHPKKKNKQKNIIKIIIKLETKKPPKPQLGYIKDTGLS